MVALIRGLARRRSDTIGNFWVDLTRATLRVLLPMAFVVAVVFVARRGPELPRLRRGQDARGHSRR